MQKDINIYEQIENYLKGNLSGDELADFENKLNSNPVFAQEVEKHRQLFELMVESTLVDLKSNLQQIHSNNIGPVSRPGLMLSILITTLSAVIIFVIYKSASNSDKVNLEENLPMVEIIPMADTSTSTTDYNNHKEIINTPVPVKTKESIQYVKKDPTPTIKTEQKEIKVSMSANTITETDTTKDIAEIRYIPDDTLSNIAVAESVFDTTPENNPVTFDCDDIIIDALIETEKSCDNKNTGSLNIVETTISGGSPPYKVSINNNSYKSELTYKNLAPAVYNVSISDINNCITQLGYYNIASKECGYEFAFAPDKGEEWEIPTLEKTGNITIYGNTGIAVFKQDFQFSNEYIWNGRTDDGSELPMGAYVFILNLDGEEPLVGNVTIIR